MNTFFKLKTSLPLAGILGFSALAFCSSAVAQVAQQSTSYTYTNEGQIDTIDGPRTDVQDVTDYDYDPTTFNLTKITYGKGELDLVQEFQNHDAAGRPQTIVDFNGLNTHVVYSPRGWVEEVRVGDGFNATVTTYEYDAVGQLICTTSPSGDKTIYGYNGARYLTSVIENANSCDATATTIGHLKTLHYNLAGDLESEKIYDGLSETDSLVYETDLRYDELSRLMEVYEKGSTNGYTHYTYDANDFVTEVEEKVDSYTGATRRFTEYTPDELGRVDSMTDAANKTIDFGYDDQGNLETVKDQRNNTTIYKYDAYGNVEKVTSPDSGVTHYVYDESNNLRFETDGRNVDKEIRYDALNRIKQIIYPANPNENVTYYYDDHQQFNDPDYSSYEIYSYPKGRLTGIDYESGKSLFYYNFMGQLKAQLDTINGEDYLTQYYYHDDGTLNWIVYPDGLRVYYLYENANGVKDGRIHKIEAAYKAHNETTVQQHTIVESVSYMPFGPEKEIVFGSGVRISKGYDKDYRLKTVQVFDPSNNLIEDLTYHYDRAGNIKQISNGTAVDMAANYDILDRLDYYKNPEFPVDAVTYEYDDVGNRRYFAPSDINDDWISYEAQYQPASNQLTQIIGNGFNAEPVTYDESGNIEHFVWQELGSDFLPETFRDSAFTYNDAGRLSTAFVDKIQYQNGSVSSSSHNELTFAYNPMQLRIEKYNALNSDLGFRDHSVYAPSGQMLQETRSLQNQGQQANERNLQWIYLNGTPIATLATSWAPDINYNSKRTLTTYYTDHLGVAKRGFNKDGIQTWNMEYTAFGEEVDIDKTYVSGEVQPENPLRFPGQYYDSETEMFYNWNRYYDPKLGRYLTSDPIGLAGGLNTFAYVGGNPVNFIDPKGLYQTCYETATRWVCRDDGKIYDPTGDSAFYDPSSNTQKPEPVDPVKCRVQPDRSVECQDDPGDPLLSCEEKVEKQYQQCKSTVKTWQTLCLVEGSAIGGALGLGVATGGVATKSALGVSGSVVGTNAGRFVCPGTEGWENACDTIKQKSKMDCDCSNN